MILIVSIILIFLVFIATLSQRLNIPLIILALSIGIIFGSDVTGLVYFDNAFMTQQFANICLIFILFAGGFGTKHHDLIPVVKPTMILATIGVLTTAGITAVLFSFMSGWSFTKSLLLSTIISSTDAAAVFSILRTRSINKNIASITEIESAANDPMAIVSTTLVIQIVAGISISTYSSILFFSWQLIGGVIFGILIGFCGSFFFDKIKNLDIGYYYIFLIGIILLSFGLSDLCKASGMLSAFFAGYIMGNRKLPYKNGISSFTNTLSFIANVTLFILLGLLVFPKQLIKVYPLGILLFITISFVARPITIFMCTSFTKLSIKEKSFLSWSGIRGAVPIVLATYPAAAGIDPDHEIFNIIFLAVVLSMIVQGTTIGKFADIMKVSIKQKVKPKQSMELVTIQDTNYELVEIFIDNELYKGECKISDLTLPTGTTITMVNRNNTVIAPSGATLLYPGDTLSVLVDKNKLNETTVQILTPFSIKNSI